MDLDIKRVLAARPGEPTDEAICVLHTTWGDGLDPIAVLGEHPRPELARSAYHMLNGWWEYAFVTRDDAAMTWERAEPPVSYEGRILVPFSPEAALSRVGRQLQPNELLWYRRCFDCPPIADGERCILHFDAVDWACAISINSRRVGTHVGAYLPFEFDITDALEAGENEITLCVFDPSETGTQLRGKQRLARGNMWYTAQSGIWQPVWYEIVPAAHVVALEVDASFDDAAVTVRARLSLPGHALGLSVVDADGLVVARGTSETHGDAQSVRVSLGQMRPWSPDDPYLYHVRVTYGDDRVESYCGFRSISVEQDADGVPRVCLNHRPLFLRGLLCQGYWPDGLMTAPTDDALVADLTYVRAHGFNMVRLHAKIERSRFYYHAARLGVVVWQDIPMGGAVPRVWPSANVPTLLRRSWRALNDRRRSVQRLLGGDDPAYQHEWRQTVRDALGRLGSHPAICAWVLFNESWGQFDARSACRDVTRELAGRALVLSVSGWYDQGVGDLYGVHNYFRGMRVYPDVSGRRSGCRRAFVISEFGGLTWRVDGHASVGTTYGYSDFESMAEWRSSLDRLLAQVDALQAEGLSGFVYTQLCDVEEEVNGLMTYDRAVDKLA